MAGSPNRGVIPDINSPTRKMPTNAELNFNPNGLGAVGSVMRDPLEAIFAYSADKAARAVTDKLYPNERGSNVADAFRHGAGSRLLTGLIGEERAKNWGDAHEVDGINPLRLAELLKMVHKNSDGERAMDLYNNSMGRQMPSGEARQIQEVVRQGLFRLRPFEE